MRYDQIVMQLRDDIWSSVLKTRVGSHVCFHFFFTSWRGMCGSLQPTPRILAWKYSGLMKAIHLL